MFRKVTTVGDNATFVNLMLVAREDPEVRETLAVILGQPSLHRKSLLNSLIERMRAQGAPSDFVLAVDALLDDAVAEKASELIREL